MRLSKVLLVAGAGVLVYKVLKSVKIVKLVSPEELLPQEFVLATEIIREVYGEEFAKGFEKAMKDNKSKTNLKMDEKLVELFAEKKEDEVQETTDEAINLHFENATKENENKTNMSMKEKVVELARERPISMQEASHAIASEVQGTTDKAKELIEDYHKNYKEVTV